MTRILTICISAVLAFHSGVFGQPSISFDLKKPPKFQERKLGSEKSADKKFTVPRRFMQNTVTHYNFYFNANNKLNEIIARAKASHKEDYSQLLPFYNYDLKTTAAFKSDLDSVIYKSTAGVLLHDLRNDWVDNLYILIGRAYYLRDELDSAYLTFQYVNYAFSPKEKDGYDKVIGSNQNEGSNAFSVSTKEKSNVVKNVFSRPPSRNESFVWQIRTYLAKNEFAEAAGLIETLRNDPYFPARLHTDLDEVQALWFYKQQMYDSAAVYLEKSLPNAANQREQARWEYLVAQLYEQSGKNDLAKNYYDRSIRHTIDPVLEVYARLNSIRQDINGEETNVQESINKLVRMAKKEQYRSYRDIIYYSAAVIELERKNTENGIFLLQQSIRNSVNNDVQKSKSFLALGNVSFFQKQYAAAQSAYDSVNIQTIPQDDLNLFNNRKIALNTIVLQSGILKRQDSLQRIAAMPETEREAYIKDLVQQIRKKQGLKDNEPVTSTDANFASNANTAPGDLFGDTKEKGEWYFYNPVLKSKGLSDFKIKWGDRPNVDNWRRISAVQGGNLTDLLPESTTPGTDVPAIPSEITYESLLNNLPLTPEKIKSSADSVEQAWFDLGNAYMNGLEDYPSAIDAFEHLVNAFPESAHSEEAWFNLYYCYSKTGEMNRLAQVKQMLSTKYPNGKFSKLLNNRNALTPDSLQKEKVTKLYEGIYNLFIEGQFAKALESKKAADSLYGQTYWTPQLLYIEAVYHIRERNDEVAKQILGKSLQLYPLSIMQPKTSNLLAVLGRRKEIEDYLAKLEIKRPDEEQPVVIQEQMPPKKEPVVEQKTDSVTAVIEEETKIDKTMVKTDVLRPEKEDPAVAAKKQEPSLQLPVPAIVTPPKEDTVVTQMETKDSVVIVKADPAPAKDTIISKVEEPEKEVVIADVKPDSVPVTKPEVNNNVPDPKVEKLQTVKRPTVTNSIYTDNPNEPFYAVLVLDKVDPVYATEARNAFNRYHKESYPSKSIEVSSVALTDDIKLILMKSFENAAAALDYIEKTRKQTELDIIPWLTPQKYSFIMLGESNLEALKKTKDIPNYKKFLNQAYPGHFK